MKRRTRCGFAIPAIAALFGVSIVCTGFVPASQAIAEETSKVTSTEELTTFTDIFKEDTETGQGLYNFSMFFKASNGVSFIIHDDNTEAGKGTADEQEAQEGSGAFAGVAMTILTDENYLNIRAEASAEAEVVGKLYPKAAAQVVGTEGEWTHITSGSVDGWVKSEYIVTGADAEKLAFEVCPEIATIQADGLKVRESADRESDVLDVVYQNEAYEVVAKLDEWVQIQYEEGETGYVAAEYVSVELQMGKAISIEEELEAIRIQKEKEAEEARKAEEARRAAQAASNQVTVPPTQQGATAASVDEAYLLACICRTEAGSYEGMLAVANVVLNRVNSSLFPGTISGVIYQSGQFAVGSRFQSYVANGPGSTAIQAANDALAGSNNVGGYLFFRSAATANTAEYSSYTIIGGNCFYQK